MGGERTIFVVADAGREPYLPRGQDRTYTTQGAGQERRLTKNRLEDIVTLLPAEAMAMHVAFTLPREVQAREARVDVVADVYLVNESRRGQRRHSAQRINARVKLCLHAITFLITAPMSVMVYSTVFTCCSYGVGRLFIPEGQPRERQKGMTQITPVLSSMPSPSFCVQQHMNVLYLQASLRILATNSSSS